MRPMKVSKHTLANGLKVIFVPKPDTQAVTTLVLVEAGSKYEDKRNNGISHFLEHMCFKGTTRRPRASDISMELDTLGAKYNAFTSQEYTGYYAKVQSKHFSQMFDLIADMYLHPRFDSKEIDKERGVIIEEINMYEDNPARAVQDYLMEVLYGNQPAGWSILGTKKTVSRFKRQDFIKYRAAHYLPQTTTVVIAGRFNQREALALIKKTFGVMPAGTALPKKAVVEKQSKPNVAVKYKESDQTHLVVAFRSRSMTHKDTYALDVLSSILGGGMSSRLTQKIRDELGAAYYVWACDDSYTDHGIFEVSVGADTKRAPDIVKTILAECRRLKKETIPAAELRRVKDHILGTMYLDLESSNNVANFYGMQQVLKHKIEAPMAYAKKIEAVTARQLKRIAREIFVAKNLNCALIGPFTSKRDFERVLKV